MASGYRFGGSLWGVRRYRDTRWLLLSGIALMLIYAGAAPFVSGKESYFRFFPPVSILLSAILSRSPFARRRFGLPGPDEFERDTLQRATLYGFRVLLLLVSGLFVWLCAASYFHWPMPRSPYDWFLWGVAILFSGLALPTLFAEFLIPFPPEADAEEDALL